MRRRVVKVLLWLCVFAALVAFHVIDRNLKQPTGPGYVPEDSQWVAVARDFDSFWGGLRRSTSYEQLATSWRPMRAFELSTRLATGIRPLPTRWKLWLGPNLWAAGTGAEYGLCVRPGLLVRGAHALNRLFGGGETDGVYRYRTLCYAWRDGFLIASRFDAYVRACLTAPPCALEPSAHRRDLRIRWTQPVTATVDIRGDDGVPVRGTVALPLTDRGEPLTLDGALSNAALQVTASTPSDVQAVWQLVRQAVAGVYGGDALLGLLPKPASGLPETGAQETACGVYGFSTPDAPPSVALAWVFPDASVELPGFVTAVQDGRRLAGGSDEVLDAAREGLAKTESVDADVTVRVQWAPFARMAEDHLLYLGEMGRMPGRDRWDVEADFVPIARGFAQEGTLHLEGRIEDGVLQFEGLLAETTALDQANPQPAAP